MSEVAPPSDVKTLVSLATYNEIENLPALVDEIFHYAPGVEILVIDDNSPDGTGRWCDERAAQDSRVHCLHRTGKLGLGTAILAGMKYAVDPEGRGRESPLFGARLPGEHVPCPAPSVVLGGVADPASVCR